MTFHMVSAYYLQGMEKTAKGHFGGGDTSWEEEKGIIYKDSDLRLAEIHDHLCHEITIGTNQVNGHKMRTYKIYLVGFINDTGIFHFLPVSRACR